MSVPPPGRPPAPSPAPPPVPATGAATRRRPAALDELDRAVLRVTARDETSPARARQVRWVAGELRRALAREDFPPGAGAGLAALLSAAPVTAYLDLAARGELRTAPRAGSPASTTASMRVRMDCLTLLARAGRVPLELPDRPPLPDLRPPVAARPRSILRAWVAEHADRPHEDPGHVRLLALVGVVLDTGARAGELCAMRVTDLAPDLSSVSVTRRPQARRDGPRTAEVMALAPSSRAALRRWLTVRETLTAAPRGGTTALWVSVRANHAGRPGADGRSAPRPPGMPLRPRGLARAYTRSVVALNAEMAGEAGWEPLPFRLEQVRRAVGAEPLAVRDLTVDRPSDEPIDAPSGHGSG